MWAAWRAVSCLLSEKAIILRSFGLSFETMLDMRMSVPVLLPIEPKVKSLLNSRGLLS